jgi:hypothetical protein
MVCIWINLTKEGGCLWSKKYGRLRKWWLIRSSRGYCQRDSPFEALSDQWLIDFFPKIPLFLLEFESFLSWKREHSLCIGGPHVEYLRGYIRRNMIDMARTRMTRNQVIEWVTHVQIHLWVCLLRWWGLSFSVVVMLILSSVFDFSHSQ